MDYIGNKCPVCDKYFHADDDIVVCPECGTPPHRECYENLGHCYHESRHADGYDYTERDEDNNKDHPIKICPSCGKENEPDAFFCKHCATPLSDRKASTSDNNTNKRDASFPLGGGSANSIPFFDPMAGVPSDTDLGDGVTAGEAAKYVKQNTPYFVRVFSNIKNLNKSKFNFAAALFSGGYLLYRKMYKIGAVITAIQALMLLTRVYLANAYTSLYVQLSEVYTGSLSTSQMFENFATFLSKRTTMEVLAIYLPTLLNLVQIVMMLVVGFTFNRMYMTHCKKKINEIKANPVNGESPDTLLQTKGGVNMPLAISLLVSVLLIEYLPTILLSLL